MNRILAGITQPLDAERMLTPLASLARRLEAPVTVLNVASGGPARRMEDARASAGRLVEGLVEAELAAEYRSIEAGHDTTGAILASAAAVEATLIVLGVNGKSQFARRSDIPMQLLRRATLPVLLLPPGAGAAF